MAYELGWEWVKWEWRQLDVFRMVLAFPPWLIVAISFVNLSSLVSSILYRIPKVLLFCSLRATRVSADVNLGRGIFIR